MAERLTAEGIVICELLHTKIVHLRILNYAVGKGSDSAVAVEMRILSEVLETAHCHMHGAFSAMNQQRADVRDMLIMLQVRSDEAEDAAEKLIKLVDRCMVTNQDERLAELKLRAENFAEVLRRLASVIEELSEPYTVDGPDGESEEDTNKSLGGAEEGKSGAEK